MTFSLRLLVLLLVFLIPRVAPAATSINFEGFVDSTALGNQYAGLTFQNAIVLSAGIGLNELESPPHSGTNVGASNGGQITITFGSPQSAVSAYVNYSGAVTFTAYSASNSVLATARSKFNSNLQVSGDAGCSPNELITVTGAGITRIAISGSSDFSFDDMASNALPPNVSNQVSVTQNGFGRNRATGLWAATMTVTNTSQSVIAGPIQVALTNISSNAQMTNNTGVLGTEPYITVTAGLSPGASASVLIQFTNPSNGFITYTPVTYSGALQ